MFQSDKNRINRSQQPQYVVQGRFQRINQHPVMFPSLFLSCSLLTLDQVFDTPPTQNASVHTFSIGVTEVRNSNLRRELSADDIEYMYQRYICWPRPHSFQICKYRQIYIFLTEQTDLYWSGVHTHFNLAIRAMSIFVDHCPILKSRCYPNNKCPFKSMPCLTNSRETNVGTLGFFSSPALYIFMFFNLGECLICRTSTSGVQGR